MDTAHVDSFISAIKPFRGRFSKELNESIERVIYDASLYSIARQNNELSNESEINRYNYVLMFIVLNGFRMSGYDFGIKVGLTWHKCGGYCNYNYAPDCGHDVYDGEGEIIQQCANCCHLYSYTKYGSELKSCELSIRTMCPRGVDNFDTITYRAYSLLTHYIKKVDQLLDDDERGYIRALSKDYANRQSILAKSLIKVFSLELAQRIINKYNFIKELCNLLIQNRC